MQKTFNAIKTNKTVLKEAIANQIIKKKKMIYFQGEIEIWYEKLAKHNEEILELIQERLNPLLNRTYPDEKEADARLSIVFWLLEKKIENLIEFFEDIQGYSSDDFEEQEIIDVFVSITTILLKELYLFHVNLEDALQNNSTNTHVEYNPNIKAELKILQNYQLLSADNKSYDWLTPLAIGFGFGFLFGSD